MTELINIFKRPLVTVEVVATLGFDFKTLCGLGKNLWILTAGAYDQPDERNNN